MSNGTAIIDFDAINFSRRDLRDIGCEFIDYLKRKIAGADLPELTGRIMINTAKRNFADFDTILIFREAVRRAIYGQLQPHNTRRQRHEGR